MSGVTDEMIDRFRAEAGQAGDLEAVVVCERALGTPPAELRRRFGRAGIDWPSIVEEVRSRTAARRTAARYVLEAAARSEEG